MFYESQAKQNLDDAEEIAKENGTWDDICAEVLDARSTLESLNLTSSSDDEFQDVYMDSITLKGRA